MMKHVMTTVLAAIAALGVFMAHSALTAGGNTSRETREMARDVSRDTGEAANGDTARVQSHDAPLVVAAQDSQDADTEVNGLTNPESASVRTDIPSRFEIESAIIQYQSAAALFRECQTLVQTNAIAELSRQKTYDSHFNRNRALMAAKLFRYAEAINARRAELTTHIATALSDDRPRSESDFERMGILTIKRDYDSLGLKLRMITDAVNRESELDRAIPARSTTVK